MGFFNLRNPALRADAVAGDEGQASKEVMTASIYFHPGAYTTSDLKLVDRYTTGESLLRGFVAHSHTSAFWAQAIPAESEAIVFGTLVWLVKLGNLKVCA